MFLIAPLVFTIAVLVLLTESSSVSEITSGNFDSLVKSSNNLWIIEFYSPTCPHCADFAPEYEDVGKQLQGSDIKVGRIDGVQYDNLAGEYNIQGFPTVKMFKPGTSIAEDYNGPRKATSIIETAKALQQSKHIRSFGVAYLNLPQGRNDQSLRLLLQYRDSNGFRMSVYDQLRLLNFMRSILSKVSYNGE